MSGTAALPGDKSIAHRLLILGAIARGSVEIRGLPASGDVRSTIACLAALFPNLEPELHGWNSKPEVRAHSGSFTSDGPRPRPPLHLSGLGREAVREPTRTLDCGNSGTTMRLLLGLLAPTPLAVTLAGDASLSRRPMERVARPLRELGASVATLEGHAPLRIEGGALRGRRFVAEMPSAQVKAAILLAGLGAAGETEVVEPTPTRDHTERLLHGLGVVPEVLPRVRAAEVPAFRADVPGDPSGAAFVATAAVASGGEVRLHGVGLNPTRLGFARILARMGARVRTQTDRHSLGEPIGTLEVAAGTSLVGVDVGPDEVAAAIDEIPALAVLAALAAGPTRFRGVGELRVKESDRLAGVVATVRALGGSADASGEDLEVGGGGLAGGTVDPQGDHRIAMAAAAAGVGTRGPVEVLDAGCAAISFPGFAEVFRSLGADVEG